jgi:superfamily II DNA or RNA helicase
MPTGAGKTRTAMELVTELISKNDWFKHDRVVIWLAHTEELCEQAIDAFSSVWATRGTESAQVVRLWGAYSPPLPSISRALVVGGTSRLHSMRVGQPKMFDTFAGKCAAVILDEAHRALAPTVTAQITALRRNDDCLLIGLSATPARTAEKSAENIALADLFGRNLIAPDLGRNPIAELRGRGILAKLERVELTYSRMDDSDEDPSSFTDDQDIPETVLSALATNPARNAALIKEIHKRASRSTPAIVFCCSVSHAQLLAAAFRLQGKRSAAIDCGMARGARRAVIHEFVSGGMEVLLNFGVLSTGFDAPNVRTVVIARPTRSPILYSQMLGRGLRGPQMGGTEFCTVVDVRDHLSRFGNLEDLYRRFEEYWT